MVFRATLGILHGNRLMATEKLPHSEQEEVPDGFRTFASVFDRFRLFQCLTGVPPTGVATLKVRKGAFDALNKGSGELGK